ncbi:hypothetical protein X975_22292, partial [Stegodyphus mimosarum]
MPKDSYMLLVCSRILDNYYRNCNLVTEISKILCVHRTNSLHVVIIRLYTCWFIAQFLSC